MAEVTPFTGGYTHDLSPDERTAVRVALEVLAGAEDTYVPPEAVHAATDLLRTIDQVQTMTFMLVPPVDYIESDYNPDF